MSSLSFNTKLDLLPEAQKQQVADFIEFLMTKSGIKKKKIIRRPGSAKGKVWMSPDFDEPLEEYKDYMQ